MVTIDRLLLASVVASIAATSAVAQDTAGFRTVARLDVGKNPHQIAFSPDGETAYVAAAGSNRITIVDAVSYEVQGSIDVAQTPLGVAVLPDGSGLAVARFGADEIAHYRLADGVAMESLVTGGAPSLLVGPMPDDRYMVSVERANALWVLDADGFTLEEKFATGRRPFPGAATSDGRVAFVPNYDDGTVTVIDLWNHRVVEQVIVGETPSGGVVLPGDIEYAVAVRGEDRIAFINTASHRVVHTLSEGIGDSPFSVVLSQNGRLGFVNNTGSADVSVMDIANSRVIARIPTGKQPIVMASHPSGTTLWVSAEGTHELDVVEIPRQWRADQPPEAASTEGMTDVAVLGMIHSRFRTSDSWGLKQLRETIRRIHPDAVCAEIAPDRWDRIWKDYTERRAIEDERIKLFPEYTDVLLRLAVEEGFEIIPCAGWTREMSDLRQARIREFRSDPKWAAKRDEYDERLAEVRAKYSVPLDDIDDPHVIHSDEYDERTREELSLYDEYMNDLIGPGGWTNINNAHLSLIDRAIRRMHGKRLLITFGAGHKYRFLDRLKTRSDVRLIDVGPYLPE
ncbi:MAG: YncE family protein [Gemmatimonadales bacterium]